jgi:hypothetical protein
MSRWHLRVRETPQGKEFSLEAEDSHQRLAGRMGATNEELLLLLRQDLEPHLAARRAKGERLELVVPDALLRLGVALGALAPGGWDVLSLASEVKLTDERGAVGPDDEPSLKYKEAIDKLQQAASWHSAGSPMHRRHRTLSRRLCCGCRGGGHSAPGHSRPSRKWMLAESAGRPHKDSRSPRSGIVPSSTASNC